MRKTILIVVGLIMAFGVALNAEESKDINSTDLDPFASNASFDDLRKVEAEEKKVKAEKEKAIAENEMVKAEKEKAIAEYEKAKAEYEKAKAENEMVTKMIVV